MSNLNVAIRAASHSFAEQPGLLRERRGGGCTPTFPWWCFVFFWECMLKTHAMVEVEATNVSEALHLRSSHLYLAKTFFPRKSNKKTIKKKVQPHIRPIGEPRQVISRVIAKIARMALPTMGARSVLNILGENDAATHSYRGTHLNVREMLNDARAAACTLPDVKTTKNSK